MNSARTNPDHPLKVVLVQPPLRNVVPAATPDYVDENRGHTPPLGLLYLHASIRRAGHQAIFLDADLKGWDHLTAAREALSHDPDIIGIQAMTFTLPDASRLARCIKKISSVPVVMGGPHATVYPRETAALEWVDFAFAGEGEIHFVDFLNHFHHPRRWPGIEGLAYFCNRRFTYTPQRHYLRDIDRIPIPARENSDYQRYSSVLAKRNPITTMITSRGCPFNCIFCNRMGRQYRYHSAEYVLAEMKEIHRLGIREIFIHDDTFTLKKSRIQSICRGLIKSDLDLIWECRTRVDLVDEALLTLMKAAGCHRISFGVESGSGRVLKAMRKDIRISQVRQVFRWCRKLGIITLADFMFGNLDEETEDIRKTRQLARQLNPDYIQFSILSPYPDTPIYHLARERGLIPNDIWQEFARNPLMKFESPVWTQHFSREELVAMTRKAYRSFYLRPRFILRQLFRIRSLEQLRTNIRGALGMLRRRSPSPD